MIKSFFLTPVVFIATCVALSKGAGISAREWQPWFGNSFEIELYSSYLYQNYSAIQSPDGSCRHSSNDFFAAFGAETDIDGSLISALELPDVGSVGLSFEILLAATSYRSFGFDSALLTLRNLWMDDSIGDSVSLATGFTLIQACQESLHDPSSFHHGKIEGELYIAIGQQSLSLSTWTSRWSAAAAIGCADVGSPWLRANIDSGYLFCDQQNSICIFANTLWGLGSKNFHCFSFKGYGPIRHQSIDIGLRYNHDFDIWGTLALEYSYRPFARNFPAHANRLLLAYTYPFSF